MSDPRVTDKVVGVAFAAFASDKFAHPVQAMRSALEAAVPLLAPQPAVDRESLESVMDDHRMHYAYGLNAACCCGWTPTEPQMWDRDHRAHIADAVLALIDGSATKETS